MRIVRSLAIVGLMTAAALSTGSCATSSPALEDRVAGSSLEQIAHDLKLASPVVDAGDAAARDAAAERLASLRSLAAVAGDRILWGGYDPAKGYDPAGYVLTEFSPEVWFKLYLSTFMFPGSFSLHREGRFEVLEMDTVFRDQLDMGDYPYPFWHSQKKWLGYVNAESVAMVFDAGELVAAFRKATGAPKATTSKFKWDEKWSWTDELGGEQPRVALYSYMFSADNPHRAPLEATYRKLEEGFRAHNCMACHAPDNAALSDPLLLLNYPNQALSGRRTIAGNLRGGKMPPKDPNGRHPAGIADPAARAELVKLAEEFERLGDAAIKFESTRHH